MAFLQQSSLYLPLLLQTFRFPFKIFPDDLFHISYTIGQRDEVVLSEHYGCFLAIIPHPPSKPPNLNIMSSYQAILQSFVLVVFRLLIIPLHCLKMLTPGSLSIPNTTALRILNDFNIHVDNTFKTLASQFFHLSYNLVFNLT